MRPRLQLGACARPLNFTLEVAEGEFCAAKMESASSLSTVACEWKLTGSACWRLRFPHPSARAADGGFD